MGKLNEALISAFRVPVFVLKTVTQADDIKQNSIEEYPIPGKSHLTGTKKM
jgi:hypothetical protein